MVEEGTVIFTLRKQPGMSLSLSYSAHLLKKKMLSYGKKSLPAVVSSLGHAVAAWKDK